MAVYFSLFLVIVTVISGIIYAIDKFYWLPIRQQKLALVQEQCDAPLPDDVIEKHLTANGLVDTAVQIFPVIAFVLVLRSFLYEPFQIPSGSMKPTLLDGDFILVNKFNYGLKDPVFRHKFLDVGLPERGDVVVFKFPLEPQIDYIKRVIGLPGDRIIYRDKKLYIKPACTPEDKKCPEFTPVEQKFVNEGEFSNSGYTLTRFTSVLGDKTHDLLVNTHTLPRLSSYHKQPGTAIDEFVVPKGQYFVMGDNRDNSLDGRFWGFVPEENLVGEAVAVWMSFEFDRAENSFLPQWLPTGVRLSRIGGIE